MTGNRNFFWAIAIGLAGFTLSNSAHALTSDALLNKLVEKGILTSQEAQDLKADDETNAPPASKFKLSDGIKSMNLYGDVRMRYEYRGAVTPGGDTFLMDRWRMSLRVGIRGDLMDDFYYGVRLETSSNPRSPWVTMGSSSGTVSYGPGGSIPSPAVGPFGKSQYSIYLGQAYIGWHPYNWVDMTIGRMPNPLYTTSMVWDSDYSPEGLAEHLKYSIGPVDLSATAAQFIYEDISPNNGVGSIQIPNASLGSNPYLLSWQLGITYHFDNTNMTAKLAPAIYNYTGRGSTVVGQNKSPDFFGPFVGQGDPVNGGNFVPNPVGFGQEPQPGGLYANETGINNLFIIDLPGELNFTVGPLDAKIFEDFSLNMEGDKRADAAYAAGGPAAFPGVSGPVHGEDKAYQIGFAIGNFSPGKNINATTGKKGSWEARTYWQHVEQYALDPNLLDSDFFEGRGNLEGIYGALSYNLTDSIISSVRYGHAKRINRMLGTGGLNADLPQLNPIDKFDVLQVDLTWKF